MKPFLAALSAALLFLLPPSAPAKEPPAAGSVQATPALWVVKDADTTLYLFGTIHLLDPKYHWFDGPVRQAFESADQLVVETTAPPADKAQAIVAKLAHDTSGRPMTARLPPKLAARYTRTLTAAGLPADALDRYRPWFAAVTLGLLPYEKAGMTAENGVDTTLIATATAIGKPIQPLETFEQQLRLFSAMSKAEEERFLALSLSELSRAPATIGTLTRAWASGDVKTLTRLMNREMRESPILATRLLDDRNANWAGWIEGRLAEPGTVFVAVGAGHLGGAASVQAILAKRGITSTRLQ
jgi:uncharacterized protein YbaP (TraB family)